MTTLTKSQMNSIEAEIRAAADNREFERASSIADQAALEIELGLGSEAQSAHFRMLANRWDERASMIAE